MRNQREAAEVRVPAPKRHQVLGPLSRRAWAAGKGEETVIGSRGFQEEAEEECTDLRNRKARTVKEARFRPGGRRRLPGFPALERKAAWAMGV